MTRARRGLVGLAAAAVTACVGITTWATASSSASIAAPLDPGAQRQQMIRLLGSIDKRLEKLDGALRDMVERLPRPEKK